MMDTYATVKHLEHAGITESHATAIAYVVGQRHDDAATKADLADFATKPDLANFATKTDLARFATKADLANFATKADLVDFVTKADLKAELVGFATKADLKVAVTNLEKQIIEVKADVGSKIETSHRELFNRLGAVLGGCTAIIIGVLKWL